MTKKILSLVLCLLFAFSSLEMTLFSFADEKADIVKDGLVAWYDGKNNTENGHDANSTVWYDLAGDNDVTVEKTEDNYFTDDAFHLKKAQYSFPSTLLDVVNSNEFTVELSLGDLKKIGSSFATFINNTGNDNFSLFIRVTGDYIEFKAGSNARPKLAGGFEYFKNSTVTITFKLGGSIRMYVDGILIGETAANSKIGATGTFFFGHAETAKSHEAEYKSMRFYNRELSNAEVINNAKADGTFDESYVPPPSFSSVQQPKTNIIGDICLSSYITSQKALNDTISSEKKPANLIFYTDKQLNITDADGKNAFTTVEELLKTLDYKFIPTFYVKDNDSANAVVKYLEEKQIIDAYIMSSNPEVVKTARTTNISIRGIIDFTAAYKGKTVTNDDLLQIRKTTISNLCHVAVLPQSIATQDNVKYLNSRQITTWVAADEAVSEKSAVEMLVSGAYGIVSDNTALVLDTATKYLKSGSLTRTPVIIGHRGIPGKMPENTLEGAIEAYNQGADVVEIDLYITVDNVVVINHDSTTSKYNRKLTVESCTYKILKELYYTHQGKQYTMPTLEDFFKEFKGKDLMLFLEIKSSKAKIVPAIKALIEEYDMYGQCAIITFEAYKQLDRLKEQIPEMPVGFLVSTSYSGHTMFPEIQKDIMKYNTTYNPSYSGFNADYVRYAVMRGVTTWPWTINESAQIFANIKNGHSGITTDNCNVTGAMAEKLTLDIDTTAKYEVGSTLKLNATKTTYKHATESVEAEYVIIEGSDIATFENNTLSFNKPGKITVMATFSDKITTFAYTVYSQPITIEVTEKPSANNTPTADTPVDDTVAPATTPEQTAPATTPTITTSPNDADNGDSTLLFIIVGAVVAIAIIGVIIGVVISKNKKKK